MSRQHDLQCRLRKAGKCIQRCGRDVAEGRIRCQVCLRKDALRKRPVGETKKTGRHRKYQAEPTK